MHLRASLLLWAGACLTTGTAALAQESAPADSVDTAAAPADSLFAEPPRNVFIPIPIIYYSPETKLALGVSAAYIYRTDPSRAESRPSTLGGVFIYTLNQQVLASIGGEQYFDEDRQQVSGGLSYRKFPNDFYGIGNDTDADFSEGYTDEGAGFALDYLREVRPGLKLGGGISFGASSITEVDAGDVLDGDLVPGAGGGNVLGVGVMARYDTRNNVSYPARGVFHQLGWRIYDTVLSGDYAFNTTSLDVRKYLSLGASRVFAIRALGVVNGGTVPFQIMPALGGDQLMRGYFGGRFRERQLIAGQAEFRTYVWKRIGLAAFGAVGQVARDLDGLAMGRFHYSYGAGLRILLIKQEMMNLRMDFGFGEDQSGFYLGFSEAF